MKPILIVALLGTILSSPAQSSASPAETNANQTIITQFLSAPFPHASRADGHKYNNEFFPADKHYSDSTVAMFVPRGFADKGSVDFVIHFHGWRNTVATTLEQFNLREQFTASPSSSCPKDLATRQIPQAANSKTPMASNDS